MVSRKSKKNLLILFSISAVVSLVIGRYFYLNFIALGILSIIVTSLKSRNHQPVVFFFFIFNWLQVSAASLWSGIKDVDINEFFPYPLTTSSMEEATLLGLMGVLIMFLIFHLQLKNLTPTKSSILTAANTINVKNNIIIYLIINFLEILLKSRIDQIGGLHQISTIFFEMSWAFLFAATVGAIVQKKLIWLLVLIYIFEFILSLTSFFSSFKYVILYFIFALLTSQQKFKTKTILIISPLVFFLIYFLIIWTSIKSEFRLIANAGERTQNISISREDALNTIFNLAKDQNRDLIEEPIHQMVKRISYTYFLARSIDNVPKIIPHQAGSNWLYSLKFNLLPRFLFPEKGSLDPSLKTMKFTGLQFATAKEGTSISLGYFADSYIDFGRIGMFFPIGIIAVFISLMYRHIINLKFNLIINLGILTIMFMKIGTIEADSTSFVGSTLVSFIYLNIILFAIMPFLTRFSVKA